MSLDDFSYSDGDVDTNRFGFGPTLEELAETQLSRRQTLSGMGAASVALLGTTFLTACGSDGTTGEGPITVSPGQTSQASSGRVVTLTSGVIEGSATNVFWRQTGGPTVTINNANSNSATFLAPSVASTTPLTFEFVATSAGGRQSSATSTVNVGQAQLGFSAVSKSLEDVVSVPAGYTVTVLYRLGDPIAAGVSAYANNGTDTNFAQRSGDHHDGMYYFGLAATGNAPDPNSNTRGVLAINHENITSRYLHPTGQTTTGGVRPIAEAIKEIEAHGVSIIEVSRAGDNGAWSYNQGSSLNRRITPFTPMAINGPARSAPFMRTAFSTDGTATRGTINNCANGYTPWNTYLTAEENWTGYFRREASDLTARAALSPKQQVSLARYGRGAASSGNNGWATATPVEAGDTRFAAFNITIQPGAPTDGTGDFRNNIFTYGWVVEIDPFDPASTPRKRTALGRMNHEGAWPGKFVAGVRPAWYTGDDAQNEYLYKFVSSTPWAAADATAANRLAIGDKYLDAGTLYVARFNDDGTGQWLPLVFGQGPLTAANAAYAFDSQADVLANARLAGDALGATRMDRPEWTAVNPVTGEMYLTLTNNSSRTVATTNAANPRAYTDLKVPSGDQVNQDPPSPPARTNGNANGHIIRLKEAGDTTEATSFAWDIYAFGSGADSTLR